MFLEKNNKIINIDKKRPFYYVYSELEKMYVFIFFTESKKENEIEVRFDTLAEIKSFINKLIEEGFNFVTFTVQKKTENYCAGFYLCEDCIVTIEKIENSDEYYICFNNNESSLQFIEEYMLLFKQSLIKALPPESIIISTKNKTLMLPKKTSFIYFSENSGYITLDLVCPLSRKKMKILPNDDEKLDELIFELRNNFKVVHLERKENIFGFNYVKNNYISLSKISEMQTKLIYEDYNEDLYFPLSLISSKLNSIKINNKLDNF